MGVGGGGRIYKLALKIGEPARLPRSGSLRRTYTDPRYLASTAGESGTDLFRSDSNVLGGRVGGYRLRDRGRARFGTGAAPKLEKLAEITARFRKESEICQFFAEKKIPN